MKTTDSVIIEESNKVMDINVNRGVEQEYHVSDLFISDASKPLESQTMLIDQVNQNEVMIMKTNPGDKYYQQIKDRKEISSLVEDFVDNDDVTADIKDKAEAIESKEAVNVSNDAFKYIGEEINIDNHTNEEYIEVISCNAMGYNREYKMTNEDDDLNKSNEQNNIYSYIKHTDSEEIPIIHDVSGCKSHKEIKLDSDSIKKSIKTNVLISSQFISGINIRHPTDEDLVDLTNENQNVEDGTQENITEEIADSDIIYTDTIKITCENQNPEMYVAYSSISIEEECETLNKVIESIEFMPDLNISEVYLNIEANAFKGPILDDKEVVTEVGESVPSKFTDVINNFNKGIINIVNEESKNLLDKEPCNLYINQNCEFITLEVNSLKTNKCTNNTFVDEDIIVLAQPQNMESIKEKNNAEEGVSDNNKEALMYNIVCEELQENKNDTIFHELIDETTHIISDKEVLFSQEKNSIDDGTVIPENLEIGNTQEEELTKTFFYSEELGTSHISIQPSQETICLKDNTLKQEAIDASSEEKTPSITLNEENNDYIQEKNIIIKDISNKIQENPSRQVLNNHEDFENIYNEINNDNNAVEDLDSENFKDISIPSELNNGNNLPISPNFFDIDDNKDKTSSKNSFSYNPEDKNANTYDFSKLIPSTSTGSIENSAMNTGARAKSNTTPVINKRSEDLVSYITTELSKLWTQNIKNLDSHNKRRVLFRLDHMKSKMCEEIVMLYEASINFSHGLFMNIMDLRQRFLTELMRQSKTPLIYNNNVHYNKGNNGNVLLIMEDQSFEKYWNNVDIPDLSYFKEYKIRMVEIQKSKLHHYSEIRSLLQKHDTPIYIIEEFVDNLILYDNFLACFIGDLLNTFNENVWRIIDDKNFITSITEQYYEIQLWYYEFYLNIK